MNDIFFLIKKTPTTLEIEKTKSEMNMYTRILKYIIIYVYMYESGLSQKEF